VAFKTWLLDFFSGMPPDIVPFFSKVVACFFYVLLGWLALIGDNLRKNKSIWNLQFLGVTLLSWFIGTMSCIISMKNFPEKAAYVTPFCTLFSEKIFNIASDWIVKKAKRFTENTTDV